MTPDEMQQREKAYHEAGHAFACFLYGIPLIDVVIGKPGEDGHITNVGLQDYKPENFFNDWETHKRFEGLIVDGSAGYCAQKKYAKIKYLVKRNYKDRESAEKFIEMIFDDPEDKKWFMEITGCTANGIMHVPIYWQVIKVLAEKLLKKIQLTGEEAQSIMNNTFRKLRCERLR